ncbi:chemotaxis protein CheW [Maricaulis sp.]|uniref:chemotaxis protein CheW n=1 Tax=unclassified Maricaulis TaxID=2632371 RepID=UPI001B19AE00|nr:chemotaxis protein CheW [Maricaulis sp.]MBO6795547.1 chemotaxis protein CheW [Maricaulis sp.]
MTAEEAVLATAEAIANGREAAPGQKQYVSFAAGSEQYAVDIMSVREIKGWTEVTSLPNQPEHVRGVLNLRGAVLPIIDLQCRLGGGLTETTQRHVIVIVAVMDRQVGLLVDAVSDILDVSDDKIQPVPETNSKEDARVFSGFLTDEDQMVAMLDLERLLGSEILDQSQSEDTPVQ